jgi:pantetheine-phosphate adenylyltransferase
VVFPGSFDPLHEGHVDLIDRALELFDEVVIGVLDNESKRPLFTVEERVEMLEELFGDRERCRVEAFGGLLVDFVRAVDAVAVLRGLRSGTDLDYELPMAFMNRRLHPAMDTVFLLPRREVADLSSTLIKEVARLGGSVEGLVPPAIRERLEARLASEGR